MKVWCSVRKVACAASVSASASGVPGHARGMARVLHQVGGGDDAPDVAGPAVAARHQPRQVRAGRDQHVVVGHRCVDVGEVPADLVFRAPSATAGRPPTTGSARSTPSMHRDNLRRTPTRAAPARRQSAGSERRQRADRRPDLHRATSSFAHRPVRASRASNAQRRGAGAGRRRCSDDGLRRSGPAAQDRASKPGAASRACGRMVPQRLEFLGTEMACSRGSTGGQLREHRPRPVAGRAACGTGPRPSRNRRAWRPIVAARPMENGRTSRPLRSHRARVRVRRACGTRGCGCRFRPCRRSARTAAPRSRNRWRSWRSSGPCPRCRP